MSDGINMVLTLKRKTARYTIIWFMYGEETAKIDVLVSNLKENGVKSEWIG